MLSLENLNLPAFKGAGRIAWTSLPLLTNIPAWKPQSITIPTFPVDPTYERRPRFVVSRTGLRELEYFTLPSFEFVDEVDDYPSSVLAITDNPDLDHIILKGLERGPKNLTITGNSKELAIELSELRTVGNAIFSDLRGLHTPLLENTTGSIELRNNTYQTITFPLLELMQGSLTIESNNNLSQLAFPLLQSIQGSLIIELNSNLAHLSFPNLSFVGSGGEGDFTVFGNDKLRTVEGFDSFQRVGGEIEIWGNISSYVSYRSTSSTLCSFLSPF